MSSLTHVDEEGAARMVDVGDKPATHRIALAEAVVHLSREAFNLVRDNRITKGDVNQVARIAGIMAAKKTSELIPLCHPIALSQIDVQISPDESRSALQIQSRVEATDRTGVEMEALVAASVAALTVYDMCKAVDRGIEISPVRLLEKHGGRSGTFIRSKCLDNSDSG